MRHLVRHLRIRRISRISRISLCSRFSIAVAVIGGMAITWGRRPSRWDGVLNRIPAAASAGSLHQPSACPARVEQLRLRGSSLDRSWRGFRWRLTAVASGWVLAVVDPQASQLHGQGLGIATDTPMWDCSANRHRSSAPELAILDPARFNAAGLQPYGPSPAAGPECLAGQT